MAYRIYDSKSLDFQLAPAMMGAAKDGASGASVPVIVSKTDVTDRLRQYVDERTYATIPDRFMPLALRWRVAPALGLPYTPFKVYKRSKKTLFAEKPVNMFNIGSSILLFGGPFWQLSFSLTNSSAFSVSVTIVPVDQYQVPIPNLQYSQNIPANSTVNVRFKFPNMNGLAFKSGSAQIQSVQGVTMQDFLNDPSWQLIEIVGFPWKSGAPAPTAYANGLQGFPNAAVGGDQAALNRLVIARLFYQNPNFSQPDGTVLPNWLPPDPQPLLDSFNKTQVTLDNQTTGVLFDIEEMLNRVHTNPVLYNGRQANYLKEYQTSSFSDTGIPGADKATVKNPVCGTTILGVSTDTWNAVGLGFGTTDFAVPGGYVDPKYVMGNPELAIENDYLLTAVFRVPRYNVEINSKGISIQKFDKFQQVEIATLAHTATAVPSVAGLANEVYAENRPLQRDAPFSDDVKIYWQKPAAGTMAGYAVAVRDLLTGQLGYLNSLRPFLDTNHRPYIPANRADEEAVDLPGSDSDAFNRFFHHRSLRPESGNATKNYYVAAIDVFGRWSAFQKTVSILTAAPLVTADIISARFIVNTTGVTEASQHIYNNSVLELVVAWHWDDRTPLDIEIGGHFVPIPAPPATINPANISKTVGITPNNTSPATLSLLLAFNANGFYMKDPNTGVFPDYKAPATEAEVVADPVNSADPNTLAYKIRIKGVSLNFESQSKLGLAVYLRSRQKNPPSLQTIFGPVKMVYVHDPIPRPAPQVLPNIRWASLPDARNVSRYRVSFNPPVAPNIAGYAIYRASEAEVRRKVGLPPTQTGQDILARNVSLQTLTPAQRNLAKDVFIRINTKMLETPQADVELPGDLEGMYIYALTSFTNQRTESGFSDWLYVAVPQRHTPPAPVLKALVNKTKDPVNPNIITQQKVALKIEIPKGVKTEKIEVFSTQREYLAASLDLMGLPLTEGGLKSLPAGWEAFDENGVKIQPVTLASPVSYYMYTQTVAASWHPRFYRAAAFGTHDANGGKFPGRSRSSNLATAVLSPPADFQLKNATIAVLNASLLRIAFFSDAEIRATSLGSFMLRIQKRNTVKNIYEEVLVRDIPLIPKKKPGDVAALNTLFRLNKDGTGCFEFELFVKNEPEAWYKVVITDPLGRRKSVDLHYKV